MPFVQVKLGDVFDGPSDLIVLPCSTAGTITAKVHRRLVNHKLPFPKAGMELGDVSIVPFEDGANISQFIAFAASVKSYYSTHEAIENIGKQLGMATIQNSAIRKVSVPLLGTGAGGLDSRMVVDALSSSFRSTAHQDGRLIIHVLDSALFEGLQPKTEEQTEFQIRSEQDSSAAPRVFVSYSRTSDSHIKWVEELATFLRSNGIDARLDSWHLRRGGDIPQWMTNELTLAERVVLVSDHKYTERADGRLGGVGWETMIVQGDLSRLPPDSNKYLVIVRSDTLDDGLPVYLRTKFVIHWPNANCDETNRRLLLQELFNITRIPPIGPRPIFV